MKSKKNFLNDFKLDVYRFTEANNTLEKKRKDVDKQLVDSMKQIQKPLCGKGPMYPGA